MGGNELRPCLCSSEEQLPGFKGAWNQAVGMLLGLYEVATWVPKWKWELQWYTSGITADMILASFEAQNAKDPSMCQQERQRLQVVKGEIPWGAGPTQSGPVMLEGFSLGEDKTYCLDQAVHTGSQSLQMFKQCSKSGSEDTASIWLTSYISADQPTHLQPHSSGLTDNRDRQSKRWLSQACLFKSTVTPQWLLQLLGIFLVLLLYLLHKFYTKC